MEKKQTAEDWLYKAFEVFPREMETLEESRKNDRQHIADTYFENGELPKPKNRRQIRKFRRRLEKAKALATEPALKNRIEGYLSYIPRWHKRRFVGSPFVLAFGVLLFGYYIYATIQNHASFAAFTNELASIWNENPKLLMFNFAYVLSFPLYFWAHRAPIWLIKRKGMNVSTSFNPLSAFRGERWKTTVKVYNGDQYVGTEEREVESGALADSIGGFFKLIFGAILLWMVLPLITLFGIVRYRFLYI